MKIPKEGPFRYAGTHIANCFDKVVLLKQLGFVCHVGVSYPGVFGYVEDIQL